MSLESKNKGKINIRLLNFELNESGAIFMSYNYLQNCFQITVLAHVLCH
jgi:hypothetical protein